MTRRNGGRKPRLPAYRLHRPSGLAVVTLAGQDHYLGRHGSPESHRAYDRLLAEWLATGSAPVRRRGVEALTVGELALRYWRQLEARVRDERSRPNIERIRLALRPLVDLYRDRPVSELGARALRAVQRRMVDQGLSRGVVNQRIGFIRRAVRWAVAEELNPGGDPKAASKTLCTCVECRSDKAFLLRRRRPSYEQARRVLRTADLFSGCGGMTLGVAEAARAAGLGIRVCFAIDHDPDAQRVFAANFIGSRAKCSGVEQWFDGRVGDAPSATERRTRRDVGRLDFLLAGPPCQGHSDLNNHTRRDDPRNALYLRVVRAAELLSPRAILIENVPSVTRDRSGVVEKSVTFLRRLGYGVTADRVDVSSLGLPQSRRRAVQWIVTAAPPCVTRST